MYKNLFKTLKIIFLFSLLLSIKINCSNDDSDPEPSWKIIFEDNFNRSDSSLNNIGDNWEIIGSYMKILNNEVVSEATIVDPIDNNDDGALAFYKVGITEKKIKISNKCRGINIRSFVSSILARYNFDGTYYSGYFAFLDNDGTVGIARWDKTDGFLITSKSFTPNINQTYLCEFILDNDNLTYNIKDINGTLLVNISTIDATYSTGKCGFAGGNVGYPLYIDDFKVEVFK